MLQRLISALAGASQSATGLSDQLRRIAASPAPAPSHNGGRRRTVAQDQRRASKQRAICRAKRLGHH